ncbi:MAG: hypothetical protein ACLFV5_04440 [Anaerolineales bacterium]
MRRRLEGRILTLLCIICSLCPVACSMHLMPMVIGTEQEYVLARFQGEKIVAVEDDDPLYERFDTHVLSDPYLDQLLTLFEDTTEAFWATNTPTSFPQTVENRLVIVVNGPRAEVLHDVVVEDDGRHVPIELALGLGQEGEVDLTHARRRFCPTMARLLWELVGLPSLDISSVSLYGTTDPSLALERGFQAAIETTHWEQRPKELEEARSERCSLVSQNAFRHRFIEGIPSADLGSCEEALQTPGVVATFFHRLLQRANTAYPQRYMLWFTNYEDANVAHAKVLYALGRTRGCGGLSVEHFIAAYAEAFPAEREMILSLAREVFGQSASAAATIPSGSR